MAPGVERVVLENEPSCTEASQEFARLTKDYSKGNQHGKARARIEHAITLMLETEGVSLPKCG